MEEGSRESSVVEESSFAVRAGLLVRTEFGQEWWPGSEGRPVEMLLALWY